MTTRYIPLVAAALALAGCGAEKKPDGFKEKKRVNSSASGKKSELEKKLQKEQSDGAESQFFMRHTQWLSERVCEEGVRRFRPAGKNSQEFNCQLEFDCSDLRTTSSYSHWVPVPVRVWASGHVYLGRHYQFERLQIDYDTEDYLVDQGFPGLRKSSQDFTSLLEQKRDGRTIDTPASRWTDNDTRILKDKYTLDLVHLNKDFSTPTCYARRPQHRSRRL